MNFEQTYTLLKHAVNGNKALYRHIKKTYGHDVMLDIAKNVPSFNATVRVLTRGPRKGLEVVTVVESAVAIDRDQMSFYLSGLPSYDAFTDVAMFIPNEKGQTMYSLVLGDADNDIDYQLNWYTCYNQDKNLLQFLKPHLKSELTSLSAQTVSKWEQQNPTMRSN